jgi:hypothetical protein
MLAAMNFGRRKPSLQPRDPAQETPSVIQSGTRRPTLASALATQALAAALMVPLHICPLLLILAIGCGSAAGFIVRTLTVPEDCLVGIALTPLLFYAALASPLLLSVPIAEITARVFRIRFLWPFCGCLLLGLFLLNRLSVDWGLGENIFGPLVEIVIYWLMILLVKKLASVIVKGSSSWASRFSTSPDVEKPETHRPEQTTRS